MATPVRGAAMAAPVCDAVMAAPMCEAVMAAPVCEAVMAAPVCEAAVQLSRIAVACAHDDASPRCPMPGQDALPGPGQDDMTYAKHASNLDAQCHASLHAPCYA